MPQDTLVAYYESVNLKDYTISKLYLIKTDSFIMEVIQMPERVLPIGISSMEFRTTYSSRANEITYCMINKANQMASYSRRPLFSDSTVRYAVEETQAGKSEVFSLYNDSLFQSRVTLSEDIPNFHSSSLYFSEITTLPVKIETAVTVTTLIAFITDINEKHRILDSLKIDIENYDVLNEEEIKQLPQKMFGISFDEFLKILKTSSAKNQ